MPIESFEEILKTLTYHQGIVLYWTCKDLKYEDIAERYGYKKSWCVWQMSFVYNKLGLDQKDPRTGQSLHWNQRREIIKGEVCPAFMRLISDDPKNIEPFPLIAEGVVVEPPSEILPPPPEPEPEPPEIPLDHEPPPPEPPVGFYPIELYNAWLMVLEDDKKGEEPPDPPPPPPPPPPNWRRILILASILGCIGCLVVGVGAYRLGRGDFVPVTVSSVPTVLALSTTEPSLTTQSTDTETPLSADTVAPTETPFPTDTPTPSPVPTEPSAFFDDFANGLNPAWTVVYGKPVVSNEQLVAGELTLLSVGDPTWTNYQVEFDVKMGRFTCGRDPSFVGVRGSDVDNMVVFAFTPCDSEWSSVINGKWSPIPGTKIGNQGYTDVLTHLVVTVEGDKIVVREKSNILGSIVDTDHMSGNVYLKIKPDTIFDNFKITLLNP